MEFAVLGPISVREGGRELPLGGPKQRALLAILLLHANEAVSRDRLIEGLWGEHPPPSAAHTLDNYISRLRKTLGGGRLARCPPGYLLRVEAEELDFDRFERLFEKGREASARGAVSDAAATLHAALALWRGPALADLLYEPFAGTESVRLEERRRMAVEERVEAELALGGGAELVPELESLVQEHPFRERLLAQLMLALYRAGRQGEALTAFQTGRQRVSGELGLEPGPQLRELQRKILDHDASLGSRRAKPPDPQPRQRQRQRWDNSRRVAVGAAVAAVAVAAAVVGIMLGKGGAHGSANGGPRQVVALSSRSGARLPGVPFSGVPAAASAAGKSLWLADPDRGSISRVDLVSRAVVERIPLDGSPAAIAADRRTVWVADVPGNRVTRIDVATGRITQTIDLGGARAAALALGEGGLWVADRVDNALLELDTETGAVLRTLTLSLRPTALAVGNGTIWAADYDAHSVVQVDSRSGRTLATIEVGKGPSALAVGPGALWVANSLDSTVSRIDPARGSVVAAIPVGSDPTAVAVAGESVWVANAYSNNVARIDPGRNVVVGTMPVGGGPTTLTAGAGKLWVGLRPLGQHRGGTLTLLHTRPISIDPALQLDLTPLQSDGLTRDGLVSYNHVGGPGGLQLVPDLAISVPTATDGGTTYTFRLRPGMRYSSGRQLRAGDFRRAIERVFHLRSDGRDRFTGIVGGVACAKANATSCDLSRGIVTDNASRTVTFHLEAPDTNFLSNLTAGGLATPVPAGTPFHDTHFRPIPGTGPYKIESATKHEIRYVRNPFFHEWSHAAQPAGNPDRIVMRFGLSPEQEVRAIENGRADWMADQPPGRLLPALKTRFASQFRSYPATETDFFQFNTALPPFDDVRVRQALNFAIDRRVIVRIYGGPDVATPTCQVLPPGLPGYRRYCPYTREPTPNGRWAAPDPARAQQLVAASGTRGARVTVWGWTDDPTLNVRVVRYTAEVLRRLGYRVHVHLVPHAYFSPPPAGVFKRIQLIPAGWIEPAAYNFFALWLSCAGAIDHGWFCYRRFDRELQRAHSLEATRPRAAAALWARIDREAVDQAAWVPLVNPRQIDFVSARVRNFQHHPYWGIAADQLWLR